MNEVDYKLLVEQVQAFADTENDFVPLFSNVSALLYEALVFIAEIFEQIFRKLIYYFI